MIGADTYLLWQEEVDWNELTALCQWATDRGELSEGCYYPSLQDQTDPKTPGQTFRAMAS